MSNSDEELTVAQRLGRALDRGLLPAGGPAEAAERLIERLERPARLALLGLPGSGKSSILNLLVGAPVIPETLRLPTIIVQHGTTARMVCTLTDGSTKILPGSNLADVLPLAPALVTVELDLAALKVISLLEVSAGPMEAEQKRAANWAAKRSDIVIWCTTSYLPKEQAVWESLPDAVKDNSFMFLTKIDLLGSKQSAAAMHDRVELRAGEDFRQILSVSAKEARAAVPPGGPVNRELFRDSGAAAVIAAIKTRVQSGRRADMDTAELLLARHVEASELVARRFAEPGGEEETRRAWVPPPESEPAAQVPADEGMPAEETPVDAAEIDTTEGPAQAPEPEVASAPEPEPESPSEPEPEPTPEPEPLGSRAAAVAGSEEDPATPRRRFADRIKRVATAGEAAPSAKVPLRSTWKSKAELEAQAALAADPEPGAKSQPPSRRPRAGLAGPAEAGGRDAQPVSPAPPVALEAEPAAGMPSEPERIVVPRERPRPDRPQALTQRPEADADGTDADSPADEPIRGSGSGRKVEGLVRGAPLPDLSSLRARPEEMAAAEESEADEAPDSEAEETVPDIPEREPDADVAARAEAGAPEAADTPEPEPAPARTVERPRLFGRDARPRPSEPPAPPAPAVPPPRTAPVTRLPASARARPAAAVPQPAASEPIDTALMSPRAIMMRDRPSEAGQPAPRRERPR
ncbi:MAG: hypothetical protein ACK4FR_12040, partial [Tabrizicola sp.]